MDKSIFLRHNIPISQKGEAWILECIKKIWDEETHSSAYIFNKAKTDYDRIRDYAMGRQSVDRYKPALGVDPKATKSKLAIDWRPPLTLGKIRNIVISRILARGYNPLCTPIDPSAKSSADEYFNKIKSKLALRDAAMQVGMDPNQLPALKMGQGEPMDWDELAEQEKYGHKINLAMETELGVRVVCNANKFHQERKQVEENKFDYGVGAYKDDIDENGDIFVRACDPGNMVVSWCEKSDFSDMRYVGELKKPALSKLSSKFNQEQLMHISDQCSRAERYINTWQRNGESSDQFDVNVLDIEFKSWNYETFRYSVNKYGNMVIREENKLVNSDKNFMFDGAEIPRYKTTGREVIYKAKWIIGTDYIYDYGLATDMKRTRPNRAKVDFSYHIDAPEFDKMTASSMMDRLIPVYDEYVTTRLRIQNFKTRWIPYIVDIDFDALENIVFTAGGAPMSKKEILDLLSQKFILLNRRKDISGQNINYKAVDVRPTGMSVEFVALTNDLARLLNEMRDIVGLNDITDASTPDPKMLNGVSSMAMQATNYALQPLVDSDKRLVESVFQGIARRIPHVVKRKKLSGLVNALGENSVRFWEVNPEVSNYDWGLIVEDMPTPEEKMNLMARLKFADANELIRPDDYLMIEVSTNLKQSSMILADRINRRIKEKQQRDLEIIKTNTDSQLQSNLQAEDQKRKTDDNSSKNKINEIREKGAIDKEIAGMKIGSAENIQQGKSATDIANNMMNIQSNESINQSSAAAI